MSESIDLSEIVLPERKKKITPTPSKQEFAEFIEIPKGSKAEKEIITTEFKPRKHHRNGSVSPFDDYPERKTSIEDDPVENAPVVVEEIDLSWFDDNGDLKPHRNVDLGQLLKLRKMGLNIPELATYFNVSKNIISGILQRNNVSMFADVYSTKKDVILESTEAKLVNAMNDENKIAQASLKDVATAFGIVYDKGRLQRGKSTDNVAVSFSGLVEGIYQKRKIQNG